MHDSTFAVTAVPPKILCVLFLRFPDFWDGSAVFPYKKIVRNQTEKLTPMIEAKYDEIYEICEKGNKLVVLEVKKVQGYKLETRGNIKSIKNI